MSDILVLPWFANSTFQAFRMKVKDLVDGMKKYQDFLKQQQERTAAHHSSSEPLRSWKDNWKKRTVEGVNVGVAKAYHSLEAALLMKEEYEPLALSVYQPDDRYARQRWLEKLELSIPVDLYAYSQGNYLGNVNFAWRLPSNLESRSDEKLIRTLNVLRDEAQIYGTRQVTKELLEPYRRVQHVTPALLRNMVEYIHPSMTVPHENEAQAKADEVVAKFLLETGDTELVMDMRANNGRLKDARFQPFWEEMTKYLEEQKAVHERRHGSISYFPFAISVRDLVVMIKSRLPEETPIPSESTVRLQFWPSNPHFESALRYTGQFKVKRAVQPRLLRMKHKDSPHCANQFSNLKSFSIHMKDFTTFVSEDDKAIIPVGPPFVPISATQRHHNRSLGCGEASDHDFHVTGLVPSVIFEIEIPDDPQDTFYKGQPHVLLKDKIFEPSSALRHSAETVKVLRGQDRLSVKPVLVQYTDGGPDHRTTYQSVQMAQVATFVTLDLDMLVSARTAPHQSYTNPAERIMSDLNLALQNASLAREEMPPAFERRMRNLNTLTAVRTAAEKDSQLKTHLLQACKPVSDAVKGRFERLLRNEVSFQVWEPASEEEVHMMVESLQLFEEDITKEDVLTKAQISKWPRLETWIKHHCRFGHYMLQVWAHTSRCYWFIFIYFICCIYFLNFYIYYSLQGTMASCIEPSLEICVYFSLADEEMWRLLVLLCKATKTTQGGIWWSTVCALPSHQKWNLPHIRGDLWDWDHRTAAQLVVHPKSNWARQAVQECTGSRYGSMHLVSIKHSIVHTCSFVCFYNTTVNMIKNPICVIEIYNGECIFVAAKVRSVIECRECEKPRVVYSGSKLTVQDLNEVKKAADSLLYVCGAPLFPSGNPLGDKVIVREALSCESPLETAYYSGTVFMLHVFLNIKHIYMYQAVYIKYLYYHCQYRCYADISSCLLLLWNNKKPGLQRWYQTTPGALLHCPANLHELFGARQGTKCP